MTHDASRRAFLKRSSMLAMAGTAAPWALSLAAMSEAAGATATDYKALVCVFLYGGNDYGNTLIPYDATRYAAYQRMRPTLAYTQAQLAGTVLAPGVALADGMQYALAKPLHPLQVGMSYSAWTLALFQLPFIWNVFASLKFGRVADANPWHEGGGAASAAARTDQG